MAEYQVGIGHDLALIALSKIVPEPSAEPVTPADRAYSAGGEFYEDAKFLKLHWDYIEHAPEYTLLLAQFDLLDNDRADVTIYAQSERLVWKRYNGVAQIPEIGEDARRSNFFLRDINMYIVDLEEIA